MATFSNPFVERESQVESATIERHPDRWVTALYGDEGRGRFLIDMVEGVRESAMLLRKYNVADRVVEEVFYDADGNVLPIQVYYTNHGYASQELFLDLRKAREYARVRSFEVTFLVRSDVVASWSPIGGYRELN